MKKAIAHLATIQKIRDDREGYIPKTAKEKPQTANDLRATPVITGSVTVGELCDDLLRHIQRNSKEYKDQRNPVYRIGLIKQEFGERIAASIRPREVSFTETVDADGVAVSCGLSLSEAINMPTRNRCPLKRLDTSTALPVSANRRR